MNAFLRTALAAIAITSSPTLLADPVPAGVGMTGITFSGTGCSSANADAMISPDGQALTVFFSEFTVATPASQKAAAYKRSYCDVKMTVSAPQGWTYAVVGADYRGYGAIGNKSKVAFTVAHATDSIGWQYQKPMTKVGPFADEFLESRTFNADSRSWAPCTTKERFINLRSIVDLWSAKGNADLFTVDSLDSSLSSKFSIQWRQCTVDEIAAETFANKVYAHLYGASPDVNGIKAKIKKDFASSKSRWTTAVNQIYTREARRAYASAVHQKLLGRAPTAQELDRVAAYGSKEAMQNYILASNEYYNRAGASFEGFLDALTRDVYDNQVALDPGAWNAYRYHTRWSIAARFLWSETGRLVAIQRSMIALMGKSAPSLEDARHLAVATTRFPSTEHIESVMMSTEEFAAH